MPLALGRRNSRRVAGLVRVLLALVLPCVSGLAVVGRAARPARAGEEYCSDANPYGGTHQNVGPALTDLGPALYTRMDGTPTAFGGGLYPGGSNALPAGHLAAGQARAGQIRPRAADGSPNPLGKIAFISVGMSNTAMEFRAFRDLALADPALNPQVVLINGATPGRTAEYWTDPISDTWQLVDDRLSGAGLTPLQVQVAWVKLTRTGPGQFPQKAQTLQADLVAVVHNLLARYPNLKQVYLSSRTRSYTYWNGLSPEPAAFETAFAVKWLIETQLAGAPDLNHDPAHGPVTAPWLAWGPYLWADGLNARSDGLVWTQQDMVADCTHPSSYGEAKVAQMLLNFFKTHPATRAWFLGDPPPPVATHKLFIPQLNRSATDAPAADRLNVWPQSAAHDE